MRHLPRWLRGSANRLAAPQAALDGSGLVEVGVLSQLFQFNLMQQRQVIQHPERSAPAWRQSGRYP